MTTGLYGAFSGRSGWGVPIRTPVQNPSDCRRIMGVPLRDHHRYALKLYTVFC